MFFAAVVCSVAAAVSLYIKSLAFVIVIVAVLCLLHLVFSKRYKYITVGLLIVLFAVSLCFRFAQIKTMNNCDNENISGKFLVVSEIETYDDFNMVTLKPKRCSALPKGTKCLVFDTKKTKLKMGDIVDANIKLSDIDRYDEYRLTNYSNGIYATADGVKFSKTGNTDAFYKMAGNIRAYVKKTISSKFKGDTAGLLLALTIGDKTLLSDKFAANIKTTGISHVVVVSGMHLAIIMMAIFWCLDRLFYNKYIRCAISIISVVLIFTVCGFTMSITRAGAMFIIAGMAPIFNRDNDSLNSLLTAVVMVLIAAPFAIFNISFQLSVLSTLAIIWVVPFYSSLFEKQFNIKSKIIKFIIDTVLCSVFAIIFTLPVTIKIFGYMSIVSPITNLVIFYPVMIAMIFNIMALIISAIPVINALSIVLFFVAGVCAQFMVFAVNLIAKLPITVAVLPKSAFWWSVLLIAVVIGYMYFYEYIKKRSDLNANSVRG